MTRQTTPDVLGDIFAAEPPALASQREAQAIRAGLRYDYSQIDPDQREAVQSAAVDIVRNGKRAQESLILIGERLIEVKALLEHGQFGDWCETEFSFTQRTAQNMMNVAQTFGGEKRNSVSLLGDATLYLLSAPSTPESARVEVIAEAQATGATPTKARVREVIASHKPTMTEIAGLIRTAPDLKAQDLRSAARQKRGNRLYDKAASNAEAHWPGAWSQTTLVNALHYVADELDRALRPTATSPEQRQYESAVPALTVPEDWRVQAMIDRMHAEEGYNLWPTDEAWLIGQIISKAQQRDWSISEQFAKTQLDEARREIAAEDQRAQKLAAARAAAEEADRTRAPAALLPGELPADLASRGWELRQVPGSGRWYANNKSGPRATAICDKPEEAIAAAYDMQRDLLAAAVEETQPAQPVPVIVDTRAPTPRDEAHAYRLAADSMDNAVKVLRLGRQYLNGHHDDMQAAIDAVIGDILALIGDLRL